MNDFSGLLIFLALFTGCSNNLERSNLIGTWELENTSTIEGEKMDFPAEQFDLSLEANGEFQIKGENKLVQGNWELIDSTLVLNGRLNEAEEMKKEEMQIFRFAKNELSFKMDFGAQPMVLLNMKRKSE